MLSDLTLAYGKQIAPAILALDAIYRQESGDRDGLVVLNMDLEKRVKPAPINNYEELYAHFKELKIASSALPEADRQVYYHQLCESLLAFIEWRSGDLPFTERLARFLHVPAQPASDVELDQLKSQIRDLLTQMGYSGDLATQCSAWESQNRVPPDQIPEVLAELMNEAWDRTEERVIPIPAPKSDGMKILPVSGKPFNARCNYLERKVELNIDPLLTRPALKHLTVHEGYPGHYLQFKLRETWARQELATEDNFFSIVNNASSCVFEGVADNGLRMLDWYDTGDDHVQALMNRYRAGVVTGAAWRLHALGWQPEKVRDWLQSNTLIGGEGWIANRMAFIAAPARSVLIWSYWWGEAIVAPAWDKVPTDQLPVFYRFMYRGLHSNDSIAMFKPERR